LAGVKPPRPLHWSIREGEAFVEALREFAVYQDLREFARTYPTPPGAAGRGARGRTRRPRRRFPEPPCWSPGRAAWGRNATAPRQGWRRLRSDARSCPAPATPSWLGGGPRGAWDLGHPCMRPEHSSFQPLASQEANLVTSWRRVSSESGVLPPRRLTRLYQIQKM
jgi:hypothetical protein